MNNCGQSSNLGHQSCTTYTTIFEWHGKHAKSVRVKTSFDGWNQVHNLHSVTDQITNETFYRCKAYFPVGRYKYKFIIDEDWVHDESKPHESDGFGGFNNIIEILPKRINTGYISAKKLNQSMQMLLKKTPSKERIEITFKVDIDDLSSIHTQSVSDFQGRNDVQILSQVNLKISGSWDDWKTKLLMKSVKSNYKKNTVFIKKMMVRPGTYFYKFLFNGCWALDNSQPYVTDEAGNSNHELKIEMLSIDERASVILFKKHRIADWNPIILTDMPNMSLYGHSISLVNDFFYVFGGRRDLGKWRNNMIKINKLNGNNTPVGDNENAPQPRGFQKVVTLENKVIFIGGSQELEIFFDCHIFNTTTKLWSEQEFSSPPSPRVHFSLSLNEGKNLIFIFGGFNKNETFNEVYCLFLDKMSWTLVETLEENHPQTRGMHTSEIISNHLYIFGGSCITEKSKRTFNDIWRLDLSEGNEQTWKNLKVSGVSPCERFGHISLKIGEKILIHGGQDVLKHSLKDLFIFSTVDRNWLQVHYHLNGCIPCGRYFHSACISDDSVYILGGRTRQKSLLDAKFMIYRLSFPT